MSEKIDPPEEEKKPTLAQKLKKKISSKTPPLRRLFSSDKKTMMRESTREPSKKISFEDDKNNPIMCRTSLRSSESELKYFEKEDNEDGLEPNPLELNLKPKTISIDINLEKNQTISLKTSKRNIFFKEKNTDSTTLGLNENFFQATAQFPNKFVDTFVIPVRYTVDQVKVKYYLKKRICNYHNN